MAEIETKRADIRSLTGLHLFHTNLSNCSQRVRLALCEKELEWESHHIDLGKDENLTPEFRQLNPNAVVPVLVHDGRTIVESNDIITYLNENFDGPQLMPESPEDREYTLDALERSSRLQAALKVLSFEFLFKPVRRMNASQLADYEELCEDPKRIAFMREFSSEEGFGSEKIRKNVAILREAFEALDQRLGENHWLGGESYGLADISWTVDAYRATVFRYSLSRHKHLDGWLKRIKARPSFTKAIAEFEPLPLKIFVGVYGPIRALRRTSISAYL